MVDDSSILPVLHVALYLLDDVVGGAFCGGIKYIRDGIAIDQSKERIFFVGKKAGKNTNFYHSPKMKITNLSTVKK